MNTTKILFVSALVILLVGCASDPVGSDRFRDFTAKQILTAGEKELENRNYREAATCFEAIDALYPYSREVQQADLNAIYAYYKAGNYTSANIAADRYIHLYPVGKNSDYAYYIKGVVSYDKDRTWLQRMHAKNVQKYDLASLKTAFIDFESLINMFPKSKYVKDAQKRMLHIRDLLAKHELETAEFYFDREAYVAAANRAGYIVEHFEGAPQTANALRVMIKSYRAMGANEQASDALRVFEKNFPKERV